MKWALLLPEPLHPDLVQGWWAGIGELQESVINDSYLPLLSTVIKWLVQVPTPTHVMLHVVAFLSINPPDQAKDLENFCQGAQEPASSAPTPQTPLDHPL